MTWLDWGVKFEVGKIANHNVNKLSKQTITEFPDILGDIIKAKLAYRSESRHHKDSR